MDNSHLKISPQVVEALKPIIGDMTRVQSFQQAHAGDTNYKVPDWVAAAKRCCCHVLFDGRQYPKLSISRRADGKLWCNACGREISTVFDETDTQKLVDALPVINKILVFGLINGLDKNAAMSLVSVKSVFPDIIQMSSELNQALDNNQKASKITGAIGSEYTSEFATMYSDGNSFSSMVNGAPFTSIQG